MGTETNVARLSEPGQSPIRIRWTHSKIREEWSVSTKGVKRSSRKTWPDAAPKEQSLDINGVPMPTPSELLNRRD